MTENNNKPNSDESTESKKVSLAEATRRMLEQKKQAQSQGKGREGFSTDTKKMKSQINKKPNNQKKRTGV